MDTIDFGPATSAVAALVAGVRDDQLGDPTPCPAYTVGDLLDHIGGFPIAFTAAARKERLDAAAASPRPTASNLDADFRERIGRRPRRAGRGLARPGGVRRDDAGRPGRAAGRGRGAGRPRRGGRARLGPGPGHRPGLRPGRGRGPRLPAVRAVLRAAGASADDGGLFGPPVPVPDDAPALDRLVGATGRDPHWTPPAA